MKVSPFYYTVRYVLNAFSHSWGFPDFFLFFYSFPLFSKCYCLPALSWSRLTFFYISIQNCVTMYTVHCTVRCSVLYSDFKYCYANFPQFWNIVTCNFPRFWILPRVLSSDFEYCHVYFPQILNITTCNFPRFWLLLRVISSDFEYCFCKTILVRVLSSGFNIAIVNTCTFLKFWS